MNDLEEPVFKSLFGETFEKCFGYRITSPLSEPDSKHLSNKIFDQTGLVIGAKSLKNYSLFIAPDKNKESKKGKSIHSYTRYLSQVCSRCTFYR